ncbi:hypothetical protein E3J68_03285 [Candidatus Aerophobetes bacterium]|uniref:Uncharacterized protein n=1 Tax=Aerophobetes bacterium TaxID=2030807 RepID=A0A523TD54_UNCAE|nr:MAG: hypothetical protein E3J68_03285 [Candidatus Aerophobetes bacterium]
MTEEKCCPQLKKEDWDKKEVEWKEKPFYKTKYHSLFHIPINFGGVVRKAMEEITSRDLDEEPAMMFSKEESMFSSTLLISLKRDAKDLETERLSGKYISMIFENGYRQTPKWMRELGKYIEGQGKVAKDFLFWYVTCPRCARKYGKTQTVIFAKVV